MYINRNKTLVLSTESKYTLPSVNCWHSGVSQ